MGSGRLQVTEDVAAAHAVAHLDVGRDRFVRRAGVAVADHDHATPREPTGEPHGAR
jgi:hypothetical protein